MARPNNPARDRAIAEALNANTPPAKIAEQVGVSVSTVYRAAERFAVAGQSKPTPPDAKPKPAAEIVQARRTISSSDLQGKAHSGLKRQAGTVYDDYDVVFRTLNRRVALYREMGDDPVAAAVLEACKKTLRRLKVYAETEGESDADDEAKTFLEQAWADMSISTSDVIDQAANCLQYGFQPAEIVYKKRQGDQKGEKAASLYDDGRIGWRKFMFMAPESLAPGQEWVFDDMGGIQGLNQQAPPKFEIVNIPIEKLILFRTTSEKGNPEGRSLFRAMYKSWYFKNNLEEIEGISAERMGAGLPVLYLGNDTNANDATLYAEWQNIVRNIRVDEQMGVLIPYQKQDPATGRGVLLELLSPSGAAVNYNETIVRHEQRMAMVGLAQFIHLGMQSVGAKAQNESSQDFFTLAVSAWADSILDTINRYAVERLFQFNYFPGLTAIPKLSHEAVAQVDLPSIADYINKLTGAQLLTPSEELERYLLELADLPITPKLTELWTQKEEQAKEQQAMAMKGQEVAIKTAQTAPIPKPGFSKNEADTDAELLSELRLARQSLELSVQAERFSMQMPPSAAPANVTVENHIDKMVMPEGFAEAFKQPAPVVNVAAPVVNVPAPVVHVAAPVVNLPAPIVNLPEGFGMQAAPTIQVNVPPATVNVRAVVETPDTETTTEIEQDKQTGRIKKTVARTRKVKS